MAVGVTVHVGAALVVVAPLLLAEPLYVLPVPAGVTAPVGAALEAVCL